MEIKTNCLKNSIIGLAGSKVIDHEKPYDYQPHIFVPTS